MSPILEQLCANTFTTNDLHRRIGLLQECLEEVMYRQTSVQSKDAFATQVLDHMRTLASESDITALSKLDNQVWDTLHVQNVGDHIHVLRIESELLPVLTLYIPVIFDDTALALVSLWVREHVHAHMLLETIVEPAVVGGCAFVFGDTYHDMSLHHAMGKQKGIITQLISSYV